MVSGGFVQAIFCVMYRKYTLTRFIFLGETPHTHAHQQPYWRKHKLMGFLCVCASEVRAAVQVGIIAVTWWQRTTTERTAALEQTLDTADTHSDAHTHCSVTLAACWLRWGLIIIRRRRTSACCFSTILEFQKYVEVSHVSEYGECPHTYLDSWTSCMLTCAGQ